MSARYEQQFFEALRQIFVGAEIDGDSGYINLMRMKSRYFSQGVFPHLRREINEALLPFPGFREELFDKLYTFFSRYFSESGSIYFVNTAPHLNIYEQVYHDDRDVALFWKTHMLYYVKTDRIFTSLQVDLDGARFFFDAAEMTLKRANEKRETVYTFETLRSDGTLVFAVTYSEKGKKTKVDEILRQVKAAGVQLSEETFTQACRVFEKQSEVDYFINKDARRFLEEQFDLWLYQYVFRGENVWAAERIAQLQTLKAIAFKVIAFIAQFEDELLRMWNKPKFVLNSHYIITLNHLLPPSSPLPQGEEGGGLGLLQKLFAQPGMAAQLQEWRDLHLIDETFSLDLLMQTDLLGEPLHPHYRFLPLDTRHFKDLELELLALFDDLESALDGWLIRSENYQALNTLLPRFRGKVQAIYIDPPYNTDASEIIYANDYKNSTWLTLMENRLVLSEQFLHYSGFHCIAIDDFEVHRLKNLLEQIFQPENFAGTIAIRNNPAGRATARGFSIAHEYLLFIAKTSDAQIGRLAHTEQQIQRYKFEDDTGKFEWVNFRKHGGLNARRVARPKLFYPIYVNAAQMTLRIPKIVWNEAKLEWQCLELPKDDENIIYPIADNGEERTWKWGHDTFQQNIGAFTVRLDQNNEIGVYMKSRLQVEGTLPRTIWYESIYSATDYGTNLLTKMFGEGQKFSFPKSVYAVEDALRVANLDSEGIVLDYFAGSGTTAHAVINLNRADGGKRKYILVEMGEHFESVILPRIKKTAFSSQWKNGYPLTPPPSPYGRGAGGEGGRGAGGEGKSGAGGEGISHFVKVYELEQYEDTLRRARYRDADLFNNPYDDPYHQYVFLRDEKMLDALELDPQANTVTLHPQRIYPNIDLAESLANLKGKAIRRITAQFVEFQDGERCDLQNPNWRDYKPLIWW